MVCLLITYLLYASNQIFCAFCLSEIELQSIDSNLVDIIWKEQPQRKFNPIISLEQNVTGKITADVLKVIRKEMDEKHCSVLALTALDEIACMSTQFFCLINSMTISSYILIQFALL